METLVIVEQQYRDELCYRVTSLESDRFGNFTFKDHNGLTGFRPTPLEISSIPVYRFSSPKTPSSSSAATIHREISVDFNEHSELWAGPTYSNSPPANSLPIPKFSIRGNRTVSLELPTNSVEEIHPIVKSAPPSPTRGHTHHDSATRTLRRILNLDVESE